MIIIYILMNKIDMYINKKIKILLIKYTIFKYVTI